MKPVESEEAAQKEAYKAFDFDTILKSSEASLLNEARIPSHDGQLVLGASQHEPEHQASKDHEDSSVRPKRGHRRRSGRSMGRFPFLTAASTLLRETDGFYSESTQKERGRKFRRIFDILQDLKASGKIASTSPITMSEKDVTEFVMWCKSNLDASTASKYIRFLGEILQHEGNGTLQKVKMRYKGLMPVPTEKSIHTIDVQDFETLVSGVFSLEDEWWEAVGKAAIAFYSHTGLRVRELRLSRLADLEMERMVIVVSQPKGKRRWASGTEESPIMPGAENVIRAYLAKREEYLIRHNQNSLEIEPLFPFLPLHGRPKYWNENLWREIARQISLSTGIKFRWKDMRPTFAQKAKDDEVPIEAISKSLRHKSTRTTELYYARIRSETAFSLMRQNWKPLSQNFNSA